VRPQPQDRSQGLSRPSRRTLPDTGLLATAGLAPRPAPRRPGLAGAAGHARRFATRRVTRAAPGSGSRGPVWKAAAGEAETTGRDAAGCPAQGGAQALIK
jgi:hypothetical protein